MWPAHLPGPQGHFGVLRFAKLRELIENGQQLIGQGRVSATKVILYIEDIYIHRLTSGGAPEILLSTLAQPVQAGLHSARKKLPVLQQK